MSTLSSITKGAQDINATIATTTLIVTAIGGLVGAIKGIVDGAREQGQDVAEFEVAIASFDAALASVQTKSAEYARLRDEQRAAEAAEQPTADGVAPSAPV